MTKVIRGQYRAAIKTGVKQETIEELANICKLKVQAELDKGNLLTGGMYQYKTMLFLYLEYITENDNLDIAAIPSDWFAEFTPFLEPWPWFGSMRHWVYMYPVFWFDQPKSLEYWKRSVKPDAGCGRIALLKPEKLFSYICHHQAIVEEGLLVGDRYQFISHHENLLFSYFETPRDRERVNILKVNKESREIIRWKDVNPKEHFELFPEAQGDDFLVISTLFWLNFQC